MAELEKANPDTLYGIFGEASWSNEHRLSDATLVNLIEHFSKQELSLERVPRIPSLAQHRGTNAQTKIF